MNGRAGRLCPPPIQDRLASKAARLGGLELLAGRRVPLHPQPLLPGHRAHDQHGPGQNFEDSLRSRTQGPTNPGRLAQLTRTRTALHSLAQPTPLGVISCY